MIEVACAVNLVPSKSPPLLTPQGGTEGGKVGKKRSSKNCCGSTWIQIFRPWTFGNLLHASVDVTTATLMYLGSMASVGFAPYGAQEGNPGSQQGV